MTIEDALSRFLIQLDADGRSPHTLAQYRRHLRTLARWAADVGSQSPSWKQVHVRLPPRRLDTAHAFVETIH